MRTVFSSINKFGKIGGKIIEKNLFLPRIYLSVLGLCRVHEVSRAAARDESEFCGLCRKVITQKSAHRNSALLSRYFRI